MTDIYYLMVYLDKHTDMLEDNQQELIEAIMDNNWKVVVHLLDEYHRLPLDKQEYFNCKYLMQKATGITWANTMDGHGWYYTK